ncbi:hypothetical protein APHCR_0012 [Anaplasma phagocytophilum str. CR1007]|nr:hypothetical protein APHCR_0012 [Anaplasma phagocytophilum str. CR1007]
MVSWEICSEFYSGMHCLIFFFQFTQFWCPDRDISVLWE